MPVVDIPSDANRFRLGIEAGALIEVPCWESHRRGRNWFATITGKDPRAPGGFARAFHNRARGEFFYLIDDVQEGDAIEFGGDYYTGSGKSVRDRVHGVVRSITDSEIVIERAKGPAGALKLAAALVVGGAEGTGEVTDEFAPAAA